MQRYARQSGATLILLLVIVATLAILAMALVSVLVNQEGATLRERARKTTTYYAEAALDDAITLAKTRTISTTAEWLSPTDLAAAFSSAGFPAGATITYLVYDNLNPVNYTIKWDKGSPTSATTPDGMVWVEATVTYQGKTTRMRVLMRQAKSTSVTSFPRAVLYSDTGISMTNTSDIYALNPDGTPDTSGAPYATQVMAGGNVAGNSSANLAAPNTSVQSVGIQLNGTLSGLSFSPANVTTGGVGLLSDYFNQASQADLGNEAQSGSPTQANSAAGVVSATTISNNSTYGGVNGVSAADVRVSGNLTLGSGTRYFRSLYVTATSPRTPAALSTARLSTSEAT